MSCRTDFVDYVKNGSDELFVSLQIGSGAGFDCKLAGKEWNSEGTIDDTIAAYETVGCHPLYNVGLPDLGLINPAIRWDDRTHAQGDKRITDRFLSTPFGDISWRWAEQKKHGITPVKYPLTSESANVFDIVNWYVEMMAETVTGVGELVAPLLAKMQPHGAVSMQWNVQPFEMLGLLAVQDLAMLAMLEAEKYRRSCSLIREVNIELLREVFKAGCDFIFLGGPGSEMLSPKLYEDFLIPDSRQIADAAHAAGGLIYSHICSPIEPFLTKGFYNQMGIDLFETFSSPPVGNVSDMAYARKICDTKMCTRGNIGLDVLLNGTIEEVEQATITVIEATRGTKHMIAASDYLFYDIPLENVLTVVRTAKQYS